MELKPCPFCGGNAKVSFRNYAYKGQNYFGDKKLKYRVQVICNQCKSKGKPIFTDWLINPNPWMSAWGNQGKATTPRMISQTEAFKPYVEKAIEAWNRRKMMFNSIRPVAPIIPNTEKEKRDSELWNAIGTAIHMCGYTGDDVTAMSIEVMKRIGRYDLLPPCERRKSGDE